MGNGGGLTNEKAYALGKFARVALKMSQIDHNGRFCMSSAAAASIEALGMNRGLPFPLEDIPHAQTILLVGSNVAETMPPVMQYFQAQRKNGGALIVADPRLTPPGDAASANHAGNRRGARQHATEYRSERALHRSFVYCAAHQRLRRSEASSCLLLARLMWRGSRLFPRSS